ncbi:MAG: 30S ribosomal protein S21 [bacterium]|jgi:small subunit ribosomal protein S21|nr:MAG: 30S ribosomal protein S21 [candidate division TM6 bacterium GW2011_GWF2_36_6]
MSKSYNIEIQVTGNLEKSLKQLKKKVEREGVIRDMKRQVYFEPPTQKKRKRLMRAVKNNIIKSMEGMLK